MEEKSLYPTRFCVLEDRYAWGTETFNAADLGYRDTLVRDGWLAGNSFSELMDTYMDRVSGEFVFDLFGRQFPVCIRTLSISGKMPLRVHPDDTTAQERYDFLGKEKLWYVVSAGKNASLMLGWRRDTDAGEMLDAFEHCEKIPELMNVIKPKAGQLFRIRPGTIHGASGEMLILEIAQSSPLDFCMHSWGQEISEEEFDPALDSLDALDFIDYKAYVNDLPEPVADGEVSTLLSIPQFEVKRIALSNALKIKNGDNSGFSLFSCVAGAAIFNSKDFAVRTGLCETALVPSDCDEYLVSPEAAGTVLLEVSVPPVKPMDSYTGERS